jgi:hypothetical protein
LLRHLLTRTRPYAKAPVRMAPFALETSLRPVRP